MLNNRGDRKRVKNCSIFSLSLSVISESKKKEKEKLRPFVLKFGQGIKFLSLLDTVRAYQSAILVESKMKQYFSEN